MQTVRDFLNFVTCSPTAYHAVAQAAVRLESAGYRRVCERRPFKLEKGGRYYLIRGGSSLVAFRLPQGELTHFQIVASHADSPTFKLKRLDEAEACGLLRLDTEGYGGAIYSTWMDRPLSLAGRICLRTDDGILFRLVDLGRDTLLIPNLPIHMNRDVNKGFALNPQVDLLPLWGVSGSIGSLARAVAESAGARPEDICGFDLFLYCRTPGTVWGADGAFFSAPRIDDLECAYTSLCAFLSAAPSDSHADVYALFDNEEVGSGSPQGADSTLLASVLRRVSSALGAEPDAAIAGSFLVSADNAHAAHPAHPEKYDEYCRCFMNAGVVIKHSAPLRYTTDAASDAVFSALARRAGVPLQHFWNRSDIPGGSTLGHIANVHASMHAIDIGLAQLAMHSAYETAGTADPDSMIRLLTAFHETDVREEDGGFRLR